MSATRCGYCGSKLHPTSHCPKTAGGQGNRNALRCSYCGSKKHNRDGCPKVFLRGPNPIRLED